MSTTTMRAVVQDAYGPPTQVLHIEQVPLPEPTNDEVLVRVKASSVNPADWHLVRGVPYVARLSLGLTRPKHRTPGGDVAGVVANVGSEVRNFVVGDEVLGQLATSGRGGFAEYVTVKADALVAKPGTLSFEDAAVLPLAGVTALQGLRTHGELQAGEHALIVGASGGVGSYAVQIAKAFGAQVTGVCSTQNVDYVAGLGADHVIDYTVADYLAQGSGPYDVVLQLGGSRRAREFRPVLTTHGRLLMAGGDGGGKLLGPVGRILGAEVLSPFVRQSLTTFNASVDTVDLGVVVELAQATKLRTEVADRVSLTDAPAAVEASEAAHTRGKVIVLPELDEPKR